MMLTVVNDYLKAKAIKIGAGTIMDPTLISAPASTNNKKASGILRCARPTMAINGNVV